MWISLIVRFYKMYKYKLHENRISTFIALFILGEVYCTDSYCVQ